MAGSSATMAWLVVVLLLTLRFDAAWGACLPELFDGKELGMHYIQNKMICSASMGKPLTEIKYGCFGAVDYVRVYQGVCSQEPGGWSKSTTHFPISELGVFSGTLSSGIYEDEVPHAKLFYTLPDWISFGRDDYKKALRVPNGVDLFDIELVSPHVVQLTFSANFYENKGPRYLPYKLCAERDGIAFHPALSEYTLPCTYIVIAPRGIRNPPIMAELVEGLYKVWVFQANFTAAEDIVVRLGGDIVDSRVMRMVHFNRYSFAAFFVKGGEYVVVQGSTETTPFRVEAVEMFVLHMSGLRALPDCTAEVVYSVKKFNFFNQGDFIKAVRCDEECTAAGEEKQVAQELSFAVSMKRCLKLCLRYAQFPEAWMPIETYRLDNTDVVPYPDCPWNLSTTVKRLFGKDSHARTRDIVLEGQWIRFENPMTFQSVVCAKGMKSRVEGEGFSATQLVVEMMGELVLLSPITVETTIASLDATISKEVDGKLTTATLITGEKGTGRPPQLGEGMMSSGCKRISLNWATTGKTRAEDMAKPSTGFLVVKLFVDVDAKNIEVRWPTQFHRSVTVGTLLLYSTSNPVTFSDHLMGTVAEPAQMAVHHGVAAIITGSMRHVTVSGQGILFLHESFGVEDCETGTEVEVYNFGSLPVLSSTVFRGVVYFYVTRFDGTLFLNQTAVWIGNDLPIDVTEGSSQISTTCPFYILSKTVFKNTNLSLSLLPPNGVLVTPCWKAVVPFFVTSTNPVNFTYGSCERILFSGGGRWFGCPVDRRSPPRETAFEGHHTFNAPHCHFQDLTISGTAELVSSVDAENINITKGSVAHFNDGAVVQEVITVERGGKVVLGSGRLTSRSIVAQPSSIVVVPDLVRRGQGCRPKAPIVLGAKSCYDRPSVHLNFTLRCEQRMGSTVKTRFYPIVEFNRCTTISQSLNVDNCFYRADKVTPVTRGDRIGVTVQRAQTQLTGVAILCVMALLPLVLLTPVFYQHGFRRAFVDFIKRPPLRLELPWDEFRYLVANWPMVVAPAIETVWVLAVCLHPDASAPALVKHLAFLRTYLIVETTHPRGYYIALYVVVSFVALWAAMWLPLLPRVFFGNSRVSLRRLNRILRAFHHNVVLVAPCVYTVALSVLFGALDCRDVEVLNDAIEPSRWNVNPRQHCWDDDHRTVVVVAMTAAFVLAVLLSYGGTQLQFPFYHPPFRTGLDLQMKRSYLPVHYSLMFTQVAAVKVLSDDVVHQLVASVVIQSLLGGLLKASAPYAYYNLNQLRQLGYKISVWSIFFALCTTLADGQDLPWCQDFVVWIYAAYTVGLAMILLEFAYNRPEYRSSQMEYAEKAVEKQKTLRRLLHDIAQHEGRPYDSSEGDSTNDPRQRIAQLKMEYQEKLESYRVFKEAYLGPFFLGSSFGMVIIEEVFNPVLHVDAPVDIREFEHWCKGKLLGKGSFGSVYIGVLQCGLLVAVKELTILGMTKSSMQKVKQEVDCMRQLSHPNIVEYRACLIDQSEMKISIFMEYCVGGSLHALVKQFKHPISEYVVRLYISQVLSGLTYLHSQHLMHRDIKGDNILIDGNGVAKLADFGCAKSTLNELSKQTVVGTPYWMAPEVIQNSRYNYKADIWSIGCTTVEALNSGSPPWTGFESVFAAMYHISHSKDTPNNIPDDLTSTCVDFLGRCFCRTPEDRATAQELLSHPWISNRSEYNSRAQEYVQRKAALDQQKFDEIKTLFSDGSFVSGSTGASSRQQEGEQSNGGQTTFFW